jgi:hypothetical protein
MMNCACVFARIFSQVRKRCVYLGQLASILAAQHTARTDAFGGVAVNADALGWALAATTSRAFRVFGPERPAALLPLIDMANHSFTPNATVTPDGSGGVRMTAVAPIPKGAPVLLNYGALSNDFLLLDYGFVARDNPHDFISLRFDESLLLNACMVRTNQAQSP